ncbi:MAG: MarR family winged helix-turn-helix transcriptional regulator [Devosia sp.]|jgi:DNA-binding MarR family transcriptional regulator|nr:MarR family transcriptional regulator [Devosiaceae bacterium]
MDVDFASCLVFNTRLAARAVIRHGDDMLRPYGVTSAQFQLLGGLRRAGPEGRNVTELAAENGLDRTSLTRSLDRLEEMGLIQSRPAAHGNGRLCTLTPAGEAMFEQLVPVWVRAQSEMRALFSESDFSTTLRALKRLSRV